MNLHLLFSKWASCYFQHWYQSWHLLFHRNQWESIRRTLQLLSFAILWRQWTPYLIQICTEIACKTHFFWKYNDLVFFRISSKEERQVNREQRRRRRQREGQKSNRFKLAKQQLCKSITLSWYISLPSLYDYKVKMPNFTFCGKREHKTTTLFFFSRTSIHYLEFNSRKNCQH